MLETVTKGFKAARNKLKGRTEITPEVVDDALRDIRVSLLEADVALDVVKRFVARVREKAIGEVVETKVKTEKGTVRVTPQDHFIKICHDELEALMGPVDTSLREGAKGRPTGVMMIGLQGSGKTTTAGKLAKRLLGEGKRPLLVAADVYRPAAVEQLKILGAQLGVPVFHDASAAPPEMCRRALVAAEREKATAIIYDTAGRLAIDEELMVELEEIKKAVAPREHSPRGRRHDRAGRGEDRGGVRPAPRARRLHPHEARRRRPRRRGPLHQGGHGQAHQVPRHG